MRLQLTVVLVVFGTLTAHADPDERRASARVSVYADDDDMLVVSPAVGLQVPATDRITTELAFVADTVTGASVDVVTSASSHAIHEQREEATLGAVIHLPRHLEVTGRAVGSHEHDYDVAHGWLLVSAELADRNLTVELGYDHGHARVGSAVDPSFHASRTDDRVVARLSQILDRRSYLDLLVDVARSDGYQASPYRMVTIGDPASPDAMRVAEVTPHERRSLAGALRLRRAIGERWFVHGGYRAVVDSWNVTSHTGDVLVIARLDDRTRIGTQARGYLQSAADFFRTRYDAPPGLVPALRTRDRTLGTMRSMALEVIGDRALGSGALRLQLAIGLSWYSWPDDPLQRDRRAVTTTTAMTTTW